VLATASDRSGPPPAAAEGRLIDTSRMLPMLPPTVTGIPDNGHAHGNGHGHGETAVVPTHREKTDAVMRRLIPILLAVTLLGIVTGIAVIMLLFLGQDWGDA